jgi:hypothetical protein
MPAPFDIGWITASHEARKRPDSRQSLIARLGAAPALTFEMSKKLQHMMGCEVANRESIDCFAKLAAHKRQQQIKRVSVALLGVAS